MAPANKFSKLSDTTSFRIGALRVEPAFRRIVHDDGRHQTIEPKIMMVLVALAHARENVVSREALFEQCWEGRIVSDDAINRVISRLRALSLEIGAGSFQLETLNKVGYRLLVVSPQEQSLDQIPSSALLQEPDLATATEPGHAVPSSLSRRRLLWGMGGAAAISLLGGGYLALHRAGSKPGRAAATSSVVVTVLPFGALSADSIAPSFAESVTTDLRSDLGRMSGIQVLAAVSSQAVAREQLSAPQIQSRTGADLLVTGSTAMERGTAIISLTLTDTHTDRQLWSTSVTGPASDLLALRDAASARLIQQIAGRIGSEASETVGPTYHRDPEVYRLTLKANQLLDSVRSLRMSDQNEAAFDAADQANQLAEQALKIDRNDPESLLILAQLARNGWTRTLAAQPLTTKQRADASLEYIRHALYADASNPLALVYLGDYYRRFEWRWDEAEVLFKRALSINASLIDAHWSYAYELGTLGNALAGLDHAITLYQLDPNNPWHRVALPRLLYLSGQYEAARKSYDAELKSTPGNVFLLYEIYFWHLSRRDAGALQMYSENLGGLWGGKPKPPGVAALLERIRSAIAALNGQPQALISKLDDDYALLEKGGHAVATLHGRARDDVPFILAMEYAWVGHFERAIDLLDQALSARSLYWPACLPYGQTPFPIEMQSNPRYQALWRRDPRLIDAVDRRRRAVEGRLMAGTLPDGSSSVPDLPVSLKLRIQTVLSRI